MPTLYIVATPIGNLEDLTLRALRVLGEVGLIAAEDTRVTRKLLARYDIHVPLMSYNEHNKDARLPALLSALACKDVALVCDAGTPVINDPGADLVRAAAEAGIAVASVPGPSAVTAAVAVSGIPVGPFTYLGFLPRRQKDRRLLLRSLTDEVRPLVIFEAPHRLRASLRDIAEALGGRRIAVCNDLTKLHEQVFRGTAEEAAELFEEPRGEYTLVIEGADPAAIEPPDEDRVRAVLSQLKAEGLRAREAVDLAANESGMSKRLVYRLWVEMGRPSPSP